MTGVDLAGLQAHLPDAPISHFPPFVDCAACNVAADRRRLAERHALDASKVWIATVAMMRNDVKLASYRLLAESLSLIESSPWQLLIVGDGPARGEVERCFAQLRARTRFLGQLCKESLATVLASSDLMLWPALKEAYGMALLEGQAAGLPVVACAEGGVPDVVTDGETGLLVPSSDPAELARATTRLLRDAHLRRRLALNAVARARSEHDIAVAADRLRGILSELALCA